MYIPAMLLGNPGWWGCSENKKKESVLHSGEKIFWWSSHHLKISGVNQHQQAKRRVYSMIISSRVGALTCPRPVHEPLHWYERKEQIHDMSVNRIICWYVLSAYPSWSHPNYHYLGYFLGACKSNQDYQNVIIFILGLGSLIQKRRIIGFKVYWLFISIHPNDNRFRYNKRKVCIGG